MALNNVWPIRISVEMKGVSTYTANARKAAAATQQVAQAVRKSAADFKSLAGAYTSMWAGRLVVQGLSTMFRSLAAVEQGMMRLSVTTGKAVKSLEAFRQKAFEVAAKTSLSPEAVLGVMNTLRQALGSDELARELTGPTSQLIMASFGKLSNEQGAKMMSEMVRGFKFSAKEAKEAGEEIFAGARSVGLGVETMSNVMGRLSMAAQVGEQSFQEITNSFMLARTVMDSSEKTARLLTSAAREMAGGKARAALGQLGINTEDPQTGKLRKHSDIFVELAKRYSHSSVRVRDALNEAFGRSAVQPIVAILLQLTKGVRTASGDLVRYGDAYDYVNKQRAESKGTFEEISAKYLMTLIGMWDEMKETAGVALLKLAEATVPFAKGLLTVGKALGTVAGWILDTNIAGWLAKLVAVLGIARAGIWGLRAVLKGLGTIMQASRAWLTENTAATFRQTVANSRLMVSVRGLQASYAGLVQTQRLAGFSSVTSHLSAATSVVGKLGGALFSLAGGPIGLIVAGVSLLIAYWEDIYNWVNKTAIEIGSMSEEQYKWYHKLAFAMGDPSGQVEKSFKLAAKIQKMKVETAKRTEESSKRMLDHMQLGSKHFNEVLDRIDKMTKWEPPVVKMRVQEEMKKRLAKLAGMGIEGQDKSAIENVLGGLGRVDQILQTVKNEKRPISPRETAEIVKLTGVAQLVSSKMATKYGGMAGVDKAMVKKFGEDVTSQWVKAGSQDNINAYGEMQPAYGSAQQSSLGGRVLGWAPHLGRIATDVQEVVSGKANGLVASLLPSKKKGVKDWWGNQGNREAAQGPVSELLSYLNGPARDTGAKVANIKESVDRASRALDTIAAAVQQQSSNLFAGGADPMSRAE